MHSRRGRCSDLAQAQLAAAHRCLLLRHAAAQRSAAERMRADAVVADHRAIAERQALAALRDRCEALARAERQQRRSRDRAAAAADDAERDDLFLLRWRRAS